MSYSPVVLFTYNRPDSTLRVIESLMRNKEAKNTELYIFSDAAKNEKQEEMVQKVRNIIKTFDKSNFKAVHIKCQMENQGLAKSIIHGVSSVFENHSKIIVLEDDCVVSPYFLKYMNMVLSKYENNSQIGSVSGFTPELKSLPDTDVYAVMRSCSLGWGTWKKCWEKVDFSMKDYEKLRHDFHFIRNLNKCGNDRMYRLIRQKKYNIQSWSIRFGAYLAKEGLLTIYPKYSYIKNIGLETGGVHSSQTVPEAMKTQNNNGIKAPCLPDKLPENMKICKEFRKIYAGNIWNQFKRTVYVYGGEKLIDAIRGTK